MCVSTNDCVLFAISFENDGSRRTLTSSKIKEKLESGSSIWIHLDQTNQSSRPFLESISLPSSEIIVNALLSDDVRGRTVKINDGMLAILRGVNLHANQQPESMLSLRCFFSDKLVITVRKYKIFSIVNLKEALLREKGPFDCGEFLLDYSKFAIDNLANELKKLELQIESLEDMIVEEGIKPSLSPVMDIRRSILHYLRHLEPQCEVYNSIHTSQVTWLNKTTRLHLQEYHHNLCRIVGDLQSWKDRARLAHEEISSLTNNKINQKLYILAILTAIFLPLSFLTGLFGVNLSGIPGSQEASAFWIFCTILICFGVFELYLLRSKKWF